MFRGDSKCGTAPAYGTFSFMLTSFSEETISSDWHWRMCYFCTGLQCFSLRRYV